MPRFFGKQIDIPGVSKNRSLSGFSWPVGTLSQLSLGRDQAGSEYRSSKLTVPHLASPGGPGQVHQGAEAGLGLPQGNVAPGECG